jgi:hypothetical protein
MSSFSQNLGSEPIARAQPVALTIAHVLMGALGSVAFFGILGMFNSPYKGLLANAFVLSIATACIAAIAIVGRDNGALSPQVK